MQYWFISDLHFGHKNILKFNPKTRQYKDIDEMDEAIIRHWNSKVETGDIVYILGDFSFRNVKDTIKILKRLNGVKILIEGNHDRKALKDNEFKEQFFDIQPYLATVINDKKFVMFHFPIYEWDHMHRGAYHLHGHVHGHPTGVKGRILDVGWDAQGTLLSFQDVVRILEKKEIRTHGDGNPDDTY